MVKVLLDRTEFMFFFLFLFLVIQNCFALSTDQQQVLHMQADSADINQQTHRGVYQSHVSIAQGSTHIECDQATSLTNDKNQLISATIKGSANKQAHYWTLTDENKPVLHAYANEIRYYPKHHLIELIGNAKVEQGKQVFRAAKISFNTQTHHVLSKSDKHQRTTLIFYPEKST